MQIKLLLMLFLSFFSKNLMTSFDNPKNKQCENLPGPALPFFVAHSSSEDGTTSPKDLQKTLTPHDNALRENQKDCNGNVSDNGGVALEMVQLSVSPNNVRRGLVARFQELKENSSKVADSLSACSACVLSKVA